MTAPLPHFCRTCRRLICEPHGCTCPDDERRPACVLGLTPEEAREVYRRSGVELPESPPLLRAG